MQVGDKKKRVEEQVSHTSGQVIVLCDAGHMCTAIRSLASSCVSLATLRPLRPLRLLRSLRAVRLVRACVIVLDKQQLKETSRDDRPLAITCGLAGAVCWRRHAWGTQNKSPN